MRYIRKCLFFSLVLFVLFPSVSNAALWKEKNVLLQLNGSYILYSSQEMPYIDKNNRILVPIRLVGDLMGADVNSDAKKKVAKLTFNDTDLELQLNSKIARVPGKTMTMDTTPAEKNGTILVPVRVLAEAFKIPFKWNSKFKIVSLDDERF